VISESFTASQKVVVVVRARRGRRLSRMSVGLTLNGGTLVAQNRDERRDRRKEVVTLRGGWEVKEERKAGLKILLTV
jgi:hypothetical protein